MESILQIQALFKLQDLQEKTQTIQELVKIHLRSQGIMFKELIHTK